MPKLPADLPENWTRGQIVSPDGIEVGLTEQHGYNYLMKQVNATQTEVNGIQDALPNVAQQQTVEEINEKIGTTTDSNGSSKAGSVFAKLNQLITDAATMVGRWTQSRADKVDSIGETTDSGATENSGTLMGKVNVLIDNANRSTPKLYKRLSIKPSIKTSGGKYNHVYRAEGEKVVHLLTLQSVFSNAVSVNLDIDGTEYFTNFGDAEPKSSGQLSYNMYPGNDQLFAFYEGSNQPQKSFVSFTCKNYFELTLVATSSNDRRSIVVIYE